MRRSTWVLFLLASAAIGFSVNCQCNPPNKTDAGDGTEGDGGEDGGEDGGALDAGEVDGGAKCRIDDHCAVFKQGLRCQESTGECIPARGCDPKNLGADCAPIGIVLDDYCDELAGLGCRCVPEASLDGYAGVCRRRRAVCEECTEDPQCGTDPKFDPPGYCRGLQGDPSGKKYCFQSLPQGSIKCGCGMVLDNGVCVPQLKSCSTVGCTQDKDCPAGSVCDVKNCLCESRCSWNFSIKALNPPGCGPGKTCWVDNANLDPTSKYYGSGRCRAPCQNDSDCTDLTKNPQGGSRLKCAGEDLGGGQVSALRCRGNGQCMDNLECPAPDAGSIYLGYCDRNDRTCRTDCRVGADPVNGQPYRDCLSEYTCVQDGGVRECVLKKCAENGGVTACYPNQLCCGEDRNLDGIPEACTGAVNIGQNQCYQAPTPPWCQVCNEGDHLFCNQWPGADPSLPNLCYPLGPRPGEQQPSGVSMCAPSTLNNTTRLADGTLAAAHGCARGYYATNVPYDVKIFGGSTPDPEDNCATNADCQAGGMNPSGTCGRDFSVFLPDGGNPLACLCTQPGQVGECPRWDAGSGFGGQSVCKSTAGTTSSCLLTVVCRPNSLLPFRAPGPPDYGCGIP